jgi:hypothetical protein
MQPKFPGSLRTGNHGVQGHWTRGVTDINANLHP